MNDRIPIILLSGMAADERLFKSQLDAFTNLRVLPWIPPLPQESLRAYAVRLAAFIDPDEPCIVGGASFGGVVAQEVATHLSAKGCILIGSIRRPGELPWRWRLLLPVAWLGPDNLRLLAAFCARFGTPFFTVSVIRQLRQVSQPDASFVRWAMCALLRWRPSSSARQTRTFHIHGSADRTFPVCRVQPDFIVPGGVHALPLSNSSAVNAFIKQVLRQIE